jgi:polysaccharide pyruvyl transferase WcaK-like protein
VNPDAATAFLQQHQLQPGQFVCCIPRLRYTPYWLVKPGTQFNAEKHGRNEEMREHDHTPLREAISRIVSETDFKVLLCPEDMTQMQVGKDNILDRLPDKVRERVVWREQYWLTDEALAVYRQSAGMFGLEMHSPIMCIGNGIPAIVCRFAEQTSKGFMWHDIGLNEWLFDADDATQVEQFVPAVLKMVTDPVAAQDKVRQAAQRVQERQTATMNQLRASLKLA